MANQWQSGFLRDDTTGALVVSGSAQSGHVIEDEGTPLTARANLNFTGAGVTASDAGGKTVVTIPGSAGAGAPNVTGTAAGDLGTAQTVDFAGVPSLQWLVGVLNGNLAVTVSNPVAGSRLKVLAIQDGTGSRTLTIAGQSVTIPTTATTGIALVTAEWVDATNFRVESAGVYTETDPNAVLKSLGTTKGDLIAFSASATPVRVAVGANNSIPVGDSGAAAGVSYKTLLTLLVAALTPTNGNVITGTGTTWTSAAPAGGGGGGGGGEALAMLAGYYWKPFESDGGNVAVLENRAYAIPFIPARSCLLNHAKAHLAVVSGAGGAARMGVYADGGGIPTTLIAEFDSTVAVTSGTGLKTFDSAAGISLTAYTKYWLVFSEQGGASPGSYKATSQYSGNTLCPVDPTNLSVGRGFYTDIGFSGAFPATAPSGWLISGDSVCIVIASDA